MNILNINSEIELNDLVKNSKTPVLVDFWADWCGPCKMMNPIFAEIAQNREDVVIAKVDVDANPQLSQDFSIMSIPTIVSFVNGEQAGRKIIGAVPEHVVHEHIDSLNQLSK